jgi:hypothetical protein
MGTSNNDFETTFGWKLNVMFFGTRPDFLAIIDWAVTAREMEGGALMLI